MVYGSKFVLCVLVDGLPQKEFNDGTVALAANCEYVLRFRNKNDRRAVVKFFIDGENVSGPGYIIEANSHTDIERHYDKPVNFKFVSTKSGDAVDFGKNGPDPERSMGVIEARFYLEKEKPKTPFVIEKHIHHHDHWPRPMPYWGGMLRSSSAGGDGGATLGIAQLSCLSEKTQTCSVPDGASQISYTCDSAPRYEAGCTVEGSISSQTFTSDYCDTETSYTSLKVVLILDKLAEPVPAKNPKLKKQPKTDLEAENEELRRKIAELENEKLKQQLADLQAK